MTEEPEVVAYMDADDIRERDEITVDKYGVEKALEVAMNHAANRLNELEKQNREWWKRMGRRYDLDFERYAYGYKRVRGEMVIVRREYEEGEISRI